MASHTTVAPYGTWKSSITPEALVSGAVGISEVVPEHDAVWWAESRPDEAGRTALMRWSAGETTEVTPPEANVRTRVHEYGGGAWWVDSGVAYYVDFSDQRVRSIAPGGEPRLLSPAPPSAGALRYADLRLSAEGSWLVAVGETHSPDLAEPRNELVGVATDGSLNTTVLVTGADFYGSPRVSPDGSKLAWVQWEHPNMAWDDTELWVGDLASSGESVLVTNPRLVAGGVGEAIVQPEWSPDGRLHFLSDRSDLWQLYVEGEVQPVLSVDGEIGYPPWVFGLSRYCFDSQAAPVAAIFAGGLEQLAGYGDYTAFNSVRTHGDKLAFAAASWSSESAVVYDGEVVREPRDLQLDPALVAPAEILEFPTGFSDPSDPNSATDTAFGLYFAPANPSYVGPTDDKPPLIVLAHGGPTSAARSQLSLARRFWTSRGFGVVDVNYRGSSGFGRAYRKKLEGEWGIADVQDCVAAANFLVDRGDVDAERLIIRGGSAGGFTV
ncbi:MAG: prolyl oligopeptidase family serine peptidase, partial [Acidimicrobiales bacterium]